MVIEIFAGSGRVTACLRQMGLSSAFGTDKVRNKNCVCPLVTVDLTENEDLLWKWLDDPFVVGVFLAPPCGSASRARQIPLRKKGKLTLRRHGPRPLRTDLHPNGIPFLNSSELCRISLSNKLYHLTAKVVRWAVQVGCIFVVENPQYSLFWATSFWTEVAHLCHYSVFTLVNMAGHGRKRQCLHSMPLNFRLSRQSALVKTVGTNTPNGASAAEAMASQQLKKRPIQWG